MVGQISSQTIFLSLFFFLLGTTAIDDDNKAIMILCSLLFALQPQKPVDTAPYF